MFSPKKIIFILLIQLLTSTLASSEVYKWIDENGKTVYGDRPGSENADQIQIKNSTDHNKESMHEREQKRNKLLDVMEQEREEKLTIKEKEKEEKTKQKEKCAELLSEVKKMKEARFIYKKTDDPLNPEIMSDQEHKAAIDKYEQFISKNC